jgi:hypothetical protein
MLEEMGLPKSVNVIVPVAGTVMVPLTVVVKVTD